VFQLYQLDNEYIVKFIGADPHPPHICLLTEYCARGSLQDVLEDSTQYEIEDVFKWVCKTALSKSEAFTWMFYPGS